MLRKFFIFGLGLLFSLHCFAQKIKLQETEEYKAAMFRYAYPCILQDGNYSAVYGPLTYLQLDPIYAHPQVLKLLDKSYLVKFNKENKKISETELSELSGSLKTEGVVSNTKKIFVLTGTEKGSSVSLSELDLNSGKLLSSTKLFSDLPKKHPLFHTKSDDGKNFAICTPNESKKENQSFQVVIFDESVKVKANYSLTINCSQKQLDNLRFLMNNSGELFCVFMKKEKDLSYHVVSYSTTGKIKGETTIGTGNGYETLFDFRLVNNRLEFQGIKAESSKKDITSFLSAAIDQGTMKTVWLKETPFSSITFKNDEFGYKNYFKDGLSNNFEFIQAHSLSNGCRISILEMNFERTTQSYFDNDLSKPSYSMPKYHTGDLIIVNQDSLGQINWVRAISKRQEQVDANFYISLASAVDGQDGLSIFFHDNVDNQDVFTNGRVKQVHIVRDIDKYSLACVYLTKNGEAKKNFIVDNSTRETFMYLRASNFIKNSSIFYYAIRVAGLKGFALRFGIMEITPP